MFDPSCLDILMFKVDSLFWLKKKKKKKFESTRCGFEAFWPVHTKTTHSLIKNGTIFDWSMHIFWYLRSCRIVSINRRFKISTLESVFEKIRFRWPFSSDSCGRRAKLTGGKKISVFKQKRVRVDGANRVFSHDVTAAILVSQSHETAAMLVSQTSPLGVELFSYAKAFLFSNKFA